MSSSLPTSSSDGPPTSGATSRTLLQAVGRILRPLVRVLLRNGIPSDAVTELVRRTYVEVAHDEFGLGDRKPTQARISVLTGLNRKEVARLLALRGADAPEEDVRRNRAAGVLTAWLRDPDFQDDKRKPLPLPFAGERSFSELCKRHSGDMKPRSIADELLASGALVEDDGQLHLTARGYVPGSDPEAFLRILGTDTAELIETVDHNLTAPADARYYQQKVLHHDVPEEHLAAFLHRSAHGAQDLLEDLDRWLAERVDETAPGRRLRLGLGTFQIVDDGTCAGSTDDSTTTD